MKWMAASMWVPVCTEQWISVALQMSPASSDRNRCSSNGGSPGQISISLCNGLVMSIQGPGTAG